MKIKVFLLLRKSTVTFHFSSLKVLKKISKYIQLIIFLSSFALLGFLIIQLYWAKNNFDEKKQNIEQLYEICLQEIGNQLNDAVLNQSSIVYPNLNSGITTIKPLEKSY